MHDRGGVRYWKRRGKNRRPRTQQGRRRQPPKHPSDVYYKAPEKRGKKRQTANVLVTQEGQSRQEGELGPHLAVIDEMRKEKNNLGYATSPQQG